MIIIVMLASCAVLVGISYLMLNILSRIVVTPKTEVRTVSALGELVVPLTGAQVVSMSISSDGRLLAWLEKEAGVAGETLRIVELTPDPPEISKRSVNGEKLAWLGQSELLVYEDAGDIQVWDARQGTQSNLTSSPEEDRDPLPSPDGRYIMWTRVPTETVSSQPELWVMDGNGSNKVILAPLADLPTWDPAGGRVISRRELVISYEEGAYQYFLETVVPGEGQWNHYAECEGEVLYIWWPMQDDLFYISPRQIKGQDTVKGVWFRVKDPRTLKEVGSTEGLSTNRAYYRFYPSREGERLTYVGERGLEYLDYEDKIIYRYTELDAEDPLAWNEGAGEIFYIGPDGIYRVSSRGE